VHDVLLDLYSPYINESLTTGIIDSMLPLVDSTVKRAFEKKCQGADITYGKNLLLVNASKMMVRNFLGFEKKRIREAAANNGYVIVKFLEQPFEKHISIPFDNGSLDIRLWGFPDRVDMENDKWKIIDYKTGKTDPKELHVSNWPDLRDNPELDKSFQLLTYASLFREKLKRNQHSVSAGIISLKKIRSGYQQVTLPGMDKHNMMIDSSVNKEFETVLFGILEDLFNTSIPFSQTTNLEICDKCPFINLCVR
jgi:hypothetical protein